MHAAKRLAARVTIFMLDLKRIVSHPAWILLSRGTCSMVFDLLGFLLMKYWEVVKSM